MKKKAHKNEIVTQVVRECVGWLHKKGDIQKKS